MKKTNIGVAFSDFVYETENRRPKKLLRSSGFGDQGEERQTQRLFLLPIALFLCVILLFSRLVSMQIIKGTYYRTLSDANRTRTTVIHAQRGIIFDRNGIPLVFNTPGFRKIQNGKTVFIDRETAIGMLALNQNGNGEHLEIDSLRYYPFADSLLHVVGYVGQVTPEDIHSPVSGGHYSPIDVIGKMGIESQYEQLLRGIDGRMLKEVDATGKEIRSLGQTDPVPGHNITLTIDSKLQQAVFDATAQVKKGAAIVSKPDGEILALVSRPSFDPNIFTMGKNNSDIGSILSDTNQPFVDRAISGTYPPGSTFKLVVAAASLESGKITKDFTVTDNGVIKIGNFSFANWYYTQYGKTEGVVDVVRAIQRSNDIFFYTVGALTGVDTLSSFAKKFSVGSVLGIDLPGEAKGLLPSKEWKQKTLGEQWYLGDDYHYGIGQGYLLTTPLQVHAWTQAIANAGSLYEPHVLMNHPSSPEDYRPLDEADGRIMNHGFLHKDVVNLIREGMVEACSPGGVAWPLFNFMVKNAALRIDGKDFFEAQDASGSADMRHVSVACKTGTAQHGGDQTLPHSWITLFAPVYNPQIILTVLGEDGGEGSNVAAPIAKKILEAYFQE